MFRQENSHLLAVNCSLMQLCLTQTQCTDNHNLFAFSNVDNVVKAG